MKKLIIFILNLNLFCCAANSSDAVIHESLDTAISLSSQQCSQKIDFPNYFAFFPEDRKKERLMLVNSISSAMHSIISRLEIPYLDPKTNSISTRHFFAQLNKLTQEKAPGAKAYIAGGMVRSLLSYIYKKIYHFDMREKEKDEDYLPEEIVRRALFNIYAGTDREEKWPEQIMAESGSIRTDKSLSSLKALGINSDYDILIDFPADFPEERKGEVLNDVTNFINSFETHLGLRDDHNELKKSIVPVGDVKDYQKQFGTRGDRSAVTQGGSTLDWLAFPLTRSAQNESFHDFRMPEGHPYILDDFLNGHLRYLPHEEGVTLGDPDKQTIRGLRALLEIPFLTFDEQSSAQMAMELKKLIDHRLSISTGAQEQLMKMIRNARFEGAHNRFNSSIPCMPDGELTRLVEQLNRSMRKGEKALPAIPEFVQNKKITARTVDKGRLSEMGVLLPVADFITQYTDNGYVYHGTPDIKNLLNVIRNGLAISSATKGREQGSAAYGTGFYTARDESTSASYAGSDGIVIPIKIKDNVPVRVLDLNTSPGNSFYKSIVANYQGMDPHRILTDEYDIDIIVSSYPLIENSDAVVIEKDTKVLLKYALEIQKDKLISELKRFGAGYFFSYSNAYDRFNKINQGYISFLKILGESYSNEDFEKLLLFCLSNVFKIEIDKLSSKIRGVNFNEYEYLEFYKLLNSRDGKIKELHDKGYPFKFTPEECDKLLSDYLFNYLQSKINNLQLRNKNSITGGYFCENEYLEFYKLLNSKDGKIRELHDKGYTFKLTPEECDDLLPEYLNNYIKKRERDLREEIDDPSSIFKESRLDHYKESILFYKQHLNGRADENSISFSEYEKNIAKSERLIDLLGGLVELDHDFRPTKGALDRFPNVNESDESFQILLRFKRHNLLKKLSNADICSLAAIRNTDFSDEYLEKINIIFNQILKINFLISEHANPMFLANSFTSQRVSLMDIFSSLQPEAIDKLKKISESNLFNITLDNIMAIARQSQGFELSEEILEKFRKITEAGVLPLSIFDLDSRNILSMINKIRDIPLSEVALGNLKRINESGIFDRHLSNSVLELILALGDAELSEETLEKLKRINESRIIYLYPDNLKKMIVALDGVQLSPDILDKLKKIDEIRIFSLDISNLKKMISALGDVELSPQLFENIKKIKENRITCSCQTPTDVKEMILALGGVELSPEILDILKQIDQRRIFSLAPKNLGEITSIISEARLARNKWDAIFNKFQINPWNSILKTPAEFRAMILTDQE